MTDANSMMKGKSERMLEVHKRMREYRMQKSRAEALRIESEPQPPWRVMSCCKKCGYHDYCIKCYYPSQIQEVCLKQVYASSCHQLCDGIHLDEVEKDNLLFYIMALVAKTCRKMADNDLFGWSETTDIITVMNVEEYLQIVKPDLDLTEVSTLLRSVAGLSVNSSYQERSDSRVFISCKECEDQFSCEMCNDTMMAQTKACFRHATNGECVWNCGGLHVSQVNEKNLLFFIMMLVSKLWQDKAYSFWSAYYCLPDSTDNITADNVLIYLQTLNPDLDLTKARAFLGYAP